MDGQMVDQVAVIPSYSHLMVSVTHRYVVELLDTSMAIQIHACPTLPSRFLVGHSSLFESHTIP